MTQQQRFGTFSSTGYDPALRPARPTTGRLRYYGRVEAEGDFRLLQLKKKALIAQGCKKESLKITY